jgi:hypothetical protein
MSNNQPQTIGGNKQKYRIFAVSKDYSIADIWAANEHEAWDVARNIDGSNFTAVAEDWEIELVRVLDDEDLRLIPFQPVN